MTVVAAFVVVTNRQQARVFTLCARVRLHAKCVIAGQFHQPLGELTDHLMVAFRLINRAERVQFSKFRPGNWDHFRRGVQLHGAGTQRDHRLVQRQIFTLQRVHVAHHLGFAVIAVKHRMAQDRVVAQHRLRDRAAVERHVFIQRVDVQTVVVAQNHAKQRQHVFTGGGFVQGHADRVEDIAAQVDFRSLSARQYGGFIRHFHAQGVEVVRMAQLLPFLLQTGCQNIGQTVNAVRNTLQTNRAMEDRVQAGDISQQYLRGTDVGVRFLAANVLLASLHRHAQRGITSGIFRYADDTARHGAFEFIFCGKEGRVRAAVTHRYAETLRRAEDNVRALLARCG